MSHVTRYAYTPSGAGVLASLPSRMVSSVGSAGMFCPLCMLALRTEGDRKKEMVS